MENTNDVLKIGMNLKKIILELIVRTINSITENIKETIVPQSKKKLSCL